MKNRQQSNLDSAIQQKVNLRDGYSSSQQQAPIQIDIDRILDQLEKFIHLKPQQMDKKRILTEQQIFGIARIAKEILIKEEALIEISAPINVCGDIHGQYLDLLRIFVYGGKVPTKSYLFLGDYVDRGKYGIQTICLLFCLKIKYPKNIFLLRGNHETASITKIYGFYNECKTKYSVKIWKCFLASFANLPIAAVIQGRILCMHGGLSPHLLKLDDIKKIQRPTQVPDQGLLCDLLWADPTVQTSVWAESERGCSYVFGSQVTTSFLRSADLDLICRAHQVVEDGYQFCHKKRVVTLFSAPNYCKEFDNAAAFMKIDENLQCQFHILKPQEKVKPFKNSKPKNQANVNR